MFSLFQEFLATLRRDRLYGMVTEDPTWHQTFMFENKYYLVLGADITKGNSTQVLKPLFPSIASRTNAERHDGALLHGEITNAAF